FHYGKQLVAVIGAGRIGRTIAHMLALEQGYYTRMCDADPVSAARVATELPLVSEAYPHPINDRAAVRDALQDAKIVIAATPASVNLQIASVAAELDIHYVDLAEDMQLMSQLRDMLQEQYPGVKSCFVPQCGLAPGYSSILATHAVKHLD